VAEGFNPGNRTGLNCIYFELRDEATEFGGRFDQLLSRFLRISGAAGGAFGGLSEARNVAGNFATALGGFANIARHFIRGGILLFYGGGDSAGNVVDLVDNLADRGDGVNGGFGIGLNSFDFAADVFGGLRRFLGELLSPPRIVRLFRSSAGLGLFWESVKGGT
jgi:hypothetical protein